MLSKLTFNSLSQLDDDIKELSFFILICFPPFVEDFKTSRMKLRFWCWSLSFVGHILTSSIACSLPTLPFLVLKSLYDSSPLTTDDGVLLRRMSLDIWAIHLILACLSVLSHHAPRVPVQGFQQEVSHKGSNSRNQIYQAYIYTVLCINM